jgi:hypothetical protein
VLFASISEARKSGVFAFLTNLTIDFGPNSQYPLHRPISTAPPNIHCTAQYPLRCSLRAILASEVQTPHNIY